MMLIFKLLAKCTNVTGLSKNCVIQVADTGFHPRGQCPLLVIPVRDTGIQHFHNHQNVVF
ncbi:hypothetical protein [Wolbachia endosymbiont (group A) of Anomoia purmunda]|uniref:hypothetical protein n=1 Tax=Wolbachia endosymbiont (group A) of Anomoia purmunda TaxID=2953978 RepID=UPI0022316BC8|nr:hypothetical protein [Wolbachia endosymbiont (group A) of Anomoia purmunda]